MHLRLYMAVLFFILLLFLGCANSIERDFALVNREKKIDPDSIAVVPGRLEDLDVMLARSISDSLAKKSKFKIKDFNKIYKKLPKNYHMVGEWGTPPTEDINKNVYWLSPANRKRVDNFQKKVRTRYIFLVWSENLSATSAVGSRGQNLGEAVYFTVYGRMIEYDSNKKIIGYTVKTYAKKSSFCFLLNIGLMFQSQTEKIEDLVKKASNIITEEIIKKSK